MFPILWRYTIFSYLKVFSLTVGTFVSVLVVLRFKDIARFAALSANGLKTILFTLYQIPSILPMAIALSALIASFLLFQRLSRSHELTAFRASGLSLKIILFPPLITSCFLSLMNFSISSELSPYCRSKSRVLLYEETSENPLLLLQRQKLINLKGAYLRINVKEDGKAARDLTCIVYNDRNERLTLLAAKKLTCQNDQLVGNNVAIVSHLKGKDPLQFDPLIIENQASMTTDARLLSGALKKYRPKIDVSHLNTRLLHLQMNMPDAKKSETALIEIFRRLSLSFAVFSFTWLGCSFGIEQGRTPPIRFLLYAALLSLSVFTSFFLGKGLTHNLILAAIILGLPHLLIWGSCLYRLHRIERGSA